MPLSKIDSDSLNSPITAVNLAYTGTLTGGTGVVNLGSGQVYKDASGNVGIGTSSPYTKLQATGTIRVATGNAQGILSLGDGGGATVNCGIWRGAANAPTTDGNYLNFGGYDGLVFATGNAAIGSQTESARIDSSGNLLVGRTSTGGTAAVSIQRPANTATYIYMMKSAQVECTWGFKASTDSNMYIGSGSTSVGTYGVYLTNTGSSWNAVSDERMKTIVEPIENAADKVVSLRAVIGYYNNDEKQLRRPFLIAQDVQAVLPEAVNIQDPETGTLGMSYTDTIPLLVAAIKELKAIVDAQGAEIAALKGTP